MGSLDSWIFVEWELHVQNILKDVALPVHLLRQVPKSTFLALFCDPFFNINFLSIFSRFGRGLGRVWRGFWEVCCVFSDCFLSVFFKAYF